MREKKGFTDSRKAKKASKSCLHQELNSTAIGEEQLFMGNTLSFKIGSTGYVQSPYILLSSGT